MLFILRRKREKYEWNFLHIATSILCVCVYVKCAFPFECYCHSWRHRVECIPVNGKSNNNKQQQKARRRRRREDRQTVMSSPSPKLRTKWWRWFIRTHRTHHPCEFSYVSSRRPLCWCIVCLIIFALHLYMYISREPLIDICAGSGECITFCCVCVN